MRCHRFRVRFWQWYAGEKQKPKIHENWRMNKFGKYLDMGDTGEKGLKVALKFWPCAIWRIVVLLIGEGTFQGEIPLLMCRGGRVEGITHFPTPTIWLMYMCASMCVYSCKCQHQLLVGWYLFCKTFISACKNKLSQTLIKSVQLIEHSCGRPKIHSLGRLADYNLVRGSCT